MYLFFSACILITFSFFSFCLYLGVLCCACSAEKKRHLLLFIYLLYSLCLNSFCFNSPSLSSAVSVAVLLCYVCLFYLLSPFLCFAFSCFSVFSLLSVPPFFLYLSPSLYYVVSFIILNAFLLFLLLFAYIVLHRFISASLRP